MNRRPPPETLAEGMSAEPARISPMMTQYFEIKTANPDSLLFYRMGDFYELFFGDAEIASRALGIVLTKRGKHEGADIRMCGVPVERADDYLQRLIALGHRVAVCEQLEDPAEAKKRGYKAVVRRDVVRLVTPGTITEDRLLEPGRANALVAVFRTKPGEAGPLYGLAALDISTGTFWLSECDEAALSVEIARIDPREVVAPQALVDDSPLSRLCSEMRIALASVGRDMSDGELAAKRIYAFYGVDTLDGFGAFTRAEIGAAALALAYVERTQLKARPALSPPSRRARGATLEIDASTRANLEMTRTLSGASAGSLLATIDLTLTPAGARLLAERLASPLTQGREIIRRLDAVAVLIAAAALRADLRDALRAAPDFVRALLRLSLDRGGPRDLAAIRDGLAVARDVAGRLGGGVELTESLAKAHADLAAVDTSLADELAAMLSDDLPLNKRDGGFVRAGASAPLDAARALRDESRRIIADLQAKYCEIVGTRQLRIKHNNFIGFYIETAQAQGEALLRPPHSALFIHRQTMAGAMRFSTNELVDLEARIASAADRALALELAAFEALRQKCLGPLEPIKRLGATLADIDVSCAFAELAATRDWTRPDIDESLSFSIEAGRHPVVEAALRARGQPFVANDCDLSGPREGGLIGLVTGPNMAGKSTYLRQNALIVILAQMGSYVPARRAHIGIVDRLFSRVGAADDLARGRSTFMVEMVETAAILNQATIRSLVILDEIGRGTATYDGLSIAYATIEHLNSVNRARTLFATHFHELTQLAKKLPRLFNLTMRVTEWNHQLVFLHEVAPGSADRSYGIQVAKLAGLPASVVARARAILSKLEATNRAGGATAVIDDLPLFAFAPKPQDQEQDPLRDHLAKIEPDELSPREAQAALYALKKLAAEKRG
jgi:DNA mismatch repair protein MutS